MSTRAQLTFYTVVAVISLCGLGESIYLTVLHLTGETILCGGSTDCSQVLASKYATLGPIPVAALGAAGYFTVFSCATFAAFSWGGARKFLVLTLLVMLLFTLWLLVVQAFLLHTFCRYCLFSAALVFLLNGLAMIIPSSAKGGVEA